ncbi:MAG: hypothetical protein WDO17_19775 [Alphaproteobacteria bacterium]
MNWVDFNGGNDVESGLLETKAQAPGSGEEVNSYQTRHGPLETSNTILTQALPDGQRTHIRFEKCA